jgi:hypothetical protein
MRENNSCGKALNVSETRGKKKRETEKIFCLGLQKREKRKEKKKKLL